MSPPPVQEHLIPGTSFGPSVITTPSPHSLDGVGVRDEASVLEHSRIPLVMRRGRRLPRASHGPLHVVRAQYWDAVCPNFAEVHCVRRQSFRIRPSGDPPLPPPPTLCFFTGVAGLFLVPVSFSRHCDCRGLCPTRAFLWAHPDPPVRVDLGFLDWVRARWLWRPRRGRFPWLKRHLPRHAFSDRGTCGPVACPSAQSMCWVRPGRCWSGVTDKSVPT